MKAPNALRKKLAEMLAGAAGGLLETSGHEGVARFTVRVPDAVLRDLRSRLVRSAWPDPVRTEPWGDGTDQDFLRRLVDHWLHPFSWRAQERLINELPHYRAMVGGTGLHFVRIRGRGPSPTPLLLCNGWPSSFLEYRRLIPFLDDAFDLIIPSLPGFAFSDIPGSPGMHVGRIAALYDELMTGVLGYPRYGAHGSDIGANVVSLIGLDAPEHLLGVHLTYVTGSAVQRELNHGAPPLTPAERQFLRRASEWNDVEGAYAHVHRTKPQTLAYALHDSPVGLASWLVEKYRAWSDCQGDVTSRFSLDELLTTITLYWVTGTIGSSMRLYYEGRLHPRQLRLGERVEVPCGVSLFPRDIAHPPREWADRAYRITRWTDMPRGGHFPAHEEPKLLAEELRAFFLPLDDRQATPYTGNQLVTD